LAVARVLWRHRNTVWASGWILWLVGLFTGYRLGLWSVGFQGYCSCLGHLFDWWPGGNQWTERVMRASLGVMGAGSLAAILAVSARPCRRKWWATAPFRHETHDQKTGRNCHRAFDDGRGDRILHF
jgi:hypothetical protein